MLVVSVRLVNTEFGGCVPVEPDPLGDQMNDQHGRNRVFRKFGIRPDLIREIPQHEFYEGPVWEARIPDVEGYVPPWQSALQGQELQLKESRRRLREMTERYTQLLAALSPGQHHTPATQPGSMSRAGRSLLVGDQTAWGAADEDAGDAPSLGSGSDEFASRMMSLGQAHSLVGRLVDAEPDVGRRLRLHQVRVELAALINEALPPPDV